MYAFTNILLTSRDANSDIAPNDIEEGWAQLVMRALNFTNAACGWPTHGMSRVSFVFCARPYVKVRSQQSVPAWRIFRFGRLRLQDSPRACSNHTTRLWQPDDVLLRRGAVVPVEFCNNSAAAA